MMISKKERLEVSALEGRMTTFTREEDFVAHLQKSKPSTLKIGQEHWLDRNKILDEMKGLEDKLLIHGYEDRAKRLKYLHTTLVQKWINKPTAFNSVLKFMVEMSEHPTGLVSLDLGETRYSASPEPVEDQIEEDIEEIQAEKRREAKLKEIVVRELLDVRNDIDYRYSSDSEGNNSDWQLSENEHEDSSITFKAKTPDAAASAANYKSIQIATQRERERARRKSLEEFWRKECSKASILIDEKLRKSDPVPLSHQPVISSAVALQSKFGELWEWKKCGASSKQILMENDIIREMLWLLTTPKSEKSQIFMKDWKLNPELMVSSLSQSSLYSLLKTYGEVLSKLERLNKFIDLVARNCSSDVTKSPQPSSKMYRVYADALQQILLRFLRKINAIEYNLKARNDHNIQDQPCTTLIQLTNQLEDFFLAIRALESFHTQVVDEDQSIPNWFSSIKLISSLQMRLNQEQNPQLYQIWIYLFAQFLRVFLQIIFGTIEGLQWTDSEWFFIRDMDINLGDPNFWKKSIVCQPTLNAKLKELKITPLTCLPKLLPKILTMLKILEMVNLLNDDKLEIDLGKLPTSEAIINEFMQWVVPNSESAGQTEETKLKLIPEADYESYFNFMGPEDSSMLECFEAVLPDCNRQPTSVQDTGPCWTKLDTFIHNLKSVPIVSIDKVLDNVIETVFDPYFQTTRISLYNILASYQVNESISLFREIILGEREDFAQAVDVLAKKAYVAPEHSYEDDKYRNTFYQKLLNECYPEGRDNFVIELILQPKSNLNYKYVVRPHFPLNLILTPKSIDLYTAISRQLHRVRKCIWSLNNLNIKRITKTAGVEPKRILCFRFALLHLFSSFRSFLLLKVFSNEFDWSKLITPSTDLDGVIQAHEKYLAGIETDVLNDRFLNDVVLKKMGSMSSALCENWHEKSGIKLSTMIKLEDTLHKCWTFLYDFSHTKHSSSICDELASFVGPIPTYLTKHSFN